MTTAHRPTFDQARAKATGPRSSIQHKRALPSHKELKFRKRAKRVNEDFESDSEEEGEIGIDGKNRAYIKKSDVEELRKRLLLEEGAKEELEKRRLELLEETKDIDGESEESGDDGEGTDDSGSGDDDSDDSDNSSDSDASDSDEELLKELEKIREEKEAKKEKEAEEALMKKAMDSNPLVDIGDEEASEHISKPWRSQVLFHNQRHASEQKTGNEFVNDMLRSDFHRRFMDKFFK